MPACISALERTSCPTPRCSPRSAAATRRPSPTCVPGERVLDLGSGGGIDVLLSAKRVGPTGRAFGLDMTDEMLALAQRNAAEAGATNVEFLKGHIEAIPLPADVDRRRDQQLRRQPRRRQAGGLPRDRPRAAAGRTARDQRHRRRGRPHARPSGPSEARTSAASRARCPSRSSGTASRPSAWPTSRSRRRMPSPTGWSARSSGRPSRPTRRRSSTSTPRGASRSPTPAAAAGPAAADHRRARDADRLTGRGPPALAPDHRRMRCSRRGQRAPHRGHRAGDRARRGPGRHPAAHGRARRAAHGTSPGKNQTRAGDEAARTAAATRASVESLEAVLPVGVLHFGQDRRIERANERAYALLEVKPGRLIGRTVMEAFLDPRAEGIISGRPGRRQRDRRGQGGRPGAARARRPRPSARRAPACSS